MTKTSQEHAMVSYIKKPRRTNHKDYQNYLLACFLSQIEPKKVIQALQDPSLIEAMQDELLQFKLLKVWRLVDLPKGKHAIRTKWVYRNKKDERGIVVRNKERLVAQGYTQEKGIDYDEVFAPVARIEAIRLFLAYASFMGFIVYQMVVKSALLYGTIEEEVYVCQPPGFKDPHFPNKVYKVEKALYGLHQAPKAWYETLSTYLLENRFRRGIIDKTLFIKKDKDDIMLAQLYVDDIIFGSTKKSLCKEFKGLMHKKFQMSSMGELTFFLGLQVMQKDDGIFISQDKYVADILKKFDFSSVKTTSTPVETNKALLKDKEVEDVDVYLYRSMIGSLMYLTTFRPDIMIFRYLKGQPKLGLWYPRDSPFDLEAFSDSDYAGASLDKKSTIGEPKKVIQALQDPSLIEAMQDELLQFKLQKVWRLVDLPKGKHAIRTKWVYRKKKDERGIVVRNKERLVAQGYTQEKGIDYDEVFAPVARIEAIRFRRGIIDKTLFIKKDKDDIMLAQLYVDDIIFGSTKKSLCTEFKGLMHKKFQMSSIGELTFFLGLQVMQKDDGIFISQDKYVADVLKKFNFSSVKTTSTPVETNKALLKDKEVEDSNLKLKGQPKLGLWYPRDSPFDLEAFSDSDYAGASLDKKSTIGGCQFLRKRQISWQCKKQTVVANSTTKAEYVAATNCHGQVLWIQN
nr:putative ribonuclease H-like domain-containing protein [Tanacetum cinerariifolium]